MAEPKQVLYSPVDISDAEYTDQFAEKTEEELDFEKFRDEMRESNQYAKITVSRQPTTSDGRPGQQKLIFLFECGMDEYSFSQLSSRCRDEYGTGVYRIQARNEKGQLKINKAIQVEAPKTEISESGNNAGDIISRMSEAMHNHQIRTEQMFSRFAGPQSGTDAFDQMTKMMTAMGTMMAGMGIQPQAPQPPKTLIEQLTEFKLLKELMGDATEGGGGEANLYSLLGKTVEAFGGPIAAAIAAGADSGQLNPEGVAQLPAPEPELTEVQKVKDAEAHKLAMRKNIHILIQNAKTEIPPDAFALILLNNTPPEKEDELWNFISAENCVDEIIAIEPAAEAYREWFDSLRLAVMDLMTEDEIPGEHPPENPDLSDSKNGSTIPESEAVAGGGDLPHDPDNGDTSSDT